MTISFCKSCTNAVINFVVSNTVEAGATATALNNNQDNDNISNTATNAGGRKRRRKRMKTGPRLGEVERRRDEIRRRR